VKIAVDFVVGHAVVCQVWLMCLSLSRPSWLRAAARLLACWSAVGLLEWYIPPSGLSLLQWLPNTPFSFHPVYPRNNTVNLHNYISHWPIFVVCCFRDESVEAYLLSVRHFYPTKTLEFCGGGGERQALYVVRWNWVLKLFVDEVFFGRKEEEGSNKESKTYRK